jgi:YebC/PmpR family DNA-binding regulatory protein
MDTDLAKTESVAHKALARMLGDTEVGDWLRATNVHTEVGLVILHTSAADKNAAALEEITYEGYGPGGVGIIIETATDNRNRTLPEVKTALVKNGGRIADAGSVLFQFTRKGVIRVAASGEDALLAVLDAGAEDASEEDGEILVYTDAKELMKVRASIVAAGLKVEDAELQYIANTPIAVSDEETSAKIMKVLDALDDVDDVVAVHTNADL